MNRQLNRKSGAARSGCNTSVQQQRANDVIGVELAAIGPRALLQFSKIETEVKSALGSLPGAPILAPIGLTTRALARWQHCALIAFRRKDRRTLGDGATHAVR